MGVTIYLEWRPPVCTFTEGKGPRLKELVSSSEAATENPGGFSAISVSGQERGAHFKDIKDGEN